VAIRSDTSQSLMLVTVLQYGHVNLPTSCLDIESGLACGSATNVTLLLHSQQRIEHDLSRDIFK